MKSNNVTKIDLGEPVERGHIHSNVMLWSDYYDSGTSPGDTIEICVLPENSNILDIDIYYPGLPSGTEIFVGDDEDEGRYIYIGSPTGAGKAAISDKIDGVMYNIAEDNKVIKMKIINNPVSGTFKTTVYYTR